MRSLLRPVVVGLAVAGMSVAGVASAQACGGHHGVKIHKNTWSTEFKNNFNRYWSPDFFSHNFNNTITFGDLNSHNDD